MLPLTWTLTLCAVLFFYALCCGARQGRKSFRGISASSLLFQLARSAVLLLYLQDQGTSWVVLVGIIKVTRERERGSVPCDVMRYDVQWLPLRARVTRYIVTVVVASSVIFLIFALLCSLPLCGCRTSCMTPGR